MVDSLPRGVVGDLRSRYHELLRDTVDAVANRPWADERSWRKEESTFLDIRSVLISTCGERPHKRFRISPVIRI
jgi:hypothetical protein